MTLQSPCISRHIVLPGYIGAAVSATGKDIIAETALEFGLSVSDLTSQRRNKALAHARFAAMKLIRDTTPKSYPEIGRLFNKRDHTTVIWGCRRAEQLLKDDPAFAEKYGRLYRKIAGV